MVKDKSTIFGMVSSFLIRCDFDKSSSDFHHLTSKDAQFGHSPPEEASGNNMIVNTESHTSKIISFKVDDHVNIDSSLARNLSFSIEEDMVVS